MTVTAAPQPDSSPNPVRSHVEMLQRLAHGVDGVLVVSVFNAALERDGGIITHHAVGDVEGMVAAIEAHSGTAGANVYCGLQVMRRTLARGHRGGGDDVVAVLGLVADIDADTGRDTGSYPLPPNLVLETSPGNRQPMWIFDRPIAPDVAKAIARGLKATTGSDHGTGDIAHVWRVPGTLNWPGPAKLARGRNPEPAAVTAVEPWDGTFTDPTALALAVSASAPRAEADPVELGDLPDVDGVEVTPEAARLLAANDVGDRSAHAARVVEKLAFDGHPAEVAAGLFLSASGDWLSRYRSEDYARQDFTRLWGRFGQPHLRAREIGAAMIEKLRGRAANDNEPDDDDEDAARPIPTAAAVGLPLELCYPPGAVGEFARWIASCARFPSPHLALASALAFTAGLIGRRYKGPTGLRSNLYVVALAESGFGKDITIRAAEALADSTPDGARVSEHIFADKLRSLPGLAGRLRKSPSCIAVIDEFGKFLSLHAGRNVAPHREEIATALMELTGAPSGSWGGAEKASGNIKRIIQPCLTIHGVSTPSTFWAALSSGNISEGLLGRLVMIDAGDGEPVKVRRPEGSLDNIPAELSAKVSALLGGSVGHLGAGPWHALSANPEAKPWPMVTVKFAPGVEDLFEAFDDRMRAMRTTLDPQYRPILNRVGENAARLALIVAVGCDPKEPVITPEIQEWANAVAEASFNTIVRGAHANIADNDRAAEYLRVRSIIERADVKGLTKGRLLVRLRGAIDGRRLDDVLDQLREAREVIFGRVTSESGQTLVRYWAREHTPEGAEPLT
ncbi:DUF3987 domain-containing protein [Ancylobacter oerskovii]|uniref:DUF3987 domain-containing protein n=1 Tax=Ancylobacter oerskovii TaxID=459519 RepID=A0ABW4Z3D5_9HYPH|nr:DUF3987 domain-containing protein [Ancylobacter oerskovii]MBS7546229.1 DUF3987 domain-containing protein [Ancylobacter oerskovii]